MPLDPEDAIKFEYEILEIIADDSPSANGALVRYTPEYEDCSIREVFVPVPFDKARDKKHALELLQRKVEARAPAGLWRSELAVDESGDTEIIGSELAAELGVEHVKPAPETDTAAERRGSEGDAGVPRESGHEGIGSRSDGDAENQDANDSEPTGGNAERARRRRRQ